MASIFRPVLAILGFLALVSMAASRNNTSAASGSLAPLFNSFDDDLGLKCYDTCLGVSRQEAIDALNWFCNNVTGRIFETSEDNYWGRWTYTNNLPPWNKAGGEIMMTINVTSGMRCVDPSIMTFDACWSNLMGGPVDRCDTSSENSKQGGNLQNGCLQYEFRPNHNVAYLCGLDDQHDSSVDAKATTVTAATTGASEASSLDCYDQCYGVPRTRAIDAVNFFCNDVAGHAFTTQSDNYTKHFTYDPDDKDQYPGYHDEGDIRLSVNVSTGIECAPTLKMTFDACWSNIMTSIVDDCNSKSENGKQGGYFVHGCLTYEFQPNPKYGPYCDIGPDGQPRSLPRGLEIDGFEQGDLAAEDFPDPETPYEDSSDNDADALTAVLETSADDDDDLQSVDCFNQCYGLPRGLLASSSRDFCTWVDGHVFGSTADNKALFWNYSHHGDSFQGPGWQEEGQIAMWIEVLDGATCDPSLIMSEPACYSWLMYGITDRCNTASVDGKQGGSLIHGCLKYTINPNPLYWPKCYFGDHQVINTPADLDAIDGSVASSSSLPNEVAAVVTATSQLVQSTLTKTNERISETTITSLEPFGRSNVSMKDDIDLPEPSCISRCFGVDRKWAVSAAAAFCNAWGDHVYTFPEDSTVTTYGYTAIEPSEEIGDHGEVEEGKIDVRIDVMPGTICNPSRIVPYDVCYQAIMYGIIDRCDTTTQNRKQGGWVLHGCLNYTINPNPEWWPDCLYEEGPGL